MRYKKTTLALCVSSAIFAGTVTAQIDSEVRKAYAEPIKAVSQFVIQLDGKPALAHGISNRSDYSNEANAVSQQQERIFQQILALDPQAKLVGQSRLLSNFITVQLSTEALSDVKTLTGVNSVLASNVDVRSAEKSELSTNNAQITSEGDTTEGITMQSPYLSSETAGRGATVAIISTGIDYTLPEFGGSGVYGDDNDPETPPVAGSYLDAFENGAIGPTIPAVADDPSTPDVDESADAIVGYDGFPTSVVVGGWDFISENWGMDGNPIDQNLDYDNGRGFVYPKGQGTQLASIVHQLAPGASLYAYKVYNVSKNPNNDSTYGRVPSHTQIAQAIEHALDPNQDGDTSDHVDVVLLDASGAAAFYQSHEQSGTSEFVTQQMIQAASAQGMTIVTPAGSFGHKSVYGEVTATNFRNWISWAGASPAAVTVGSAVMADDGETVTPASWSPMGPVRGSNDLKPEVMSIAKDMPVALVSNSDENAAKLARRTGADVASARIAAAIAVIKAAHPDLGPVELKAILANTANHNIKETDFKTGEILEQAELIYIGHGTENIESATTTPIAAWNTENNQPYVQFGFHEVADELTIVKNITLRNFSDQAHTYNLDYMANGDKEAQLALTINHPSIVSIPAHHSVTIAVSIDIDGTMLPAWPLTSSEEYTDENYKATELNGYFQLTAEGQPELNVGWMIQARPSSDIDKSAITKEYPISLGWNSDLGRSEYESLEWAESIYPNRDEHTPTYFALTSSISNTSNTPTTYEVYPTVIETAAEPVGKERTYGHKIKTVGGGIYDDASCEVTGKKISIAVNLWQPAATAMANHFDKIGTPLFYYDLIPEQVVKDLGMDESFTGYSKYDVAKGEAAMLGQTWVELNEYGEPATYYLDYSKEYDRFNPTGRYKQSSLPVRITPNGTNIVSEVCLGELAHHDISDAPDDENIPLEVPVLDDNGDMLAEMVQCEGMTLEELLEYDYFADYGHYYCSSSTGLWDNEGYALDENGDRLITMVENTERGVPGQNELLNFFDQNFGFSIGTDRDTQNLKFAPVAQFNPTRLGYFEEDVEVCMDTWIGYSCEIADIDYSVHAGFSVITEENPIETADFNHIITLQPGEEATVAAARIGSFGSGHGQVMVISTDDNFSMTSPVSYLDDDGSVVAEVRSDQEFTINENPDYDAVVGKIKLDTAGLFAISESRYSSFDLNIVNALPGSPFAINQETHELYVSNPDSIDFENNTRFDVIIQTVQGNSLSVPVTVTVWVNNLNDVAPIIVAPISTVNTQITDDRYAYISIDITSMFADPEGDSLTYTVEGLPEGVHFAEGVIQGNPTYPGRYNITVIASDGVNSSSSSFELVVADETSSSSSDGGSFGSFLLALAGLSLFRRRK